MEMESDSECSVIDLTLSTDSDEDATDGIDTDSVVLLHGSTPKRQRLSPPSSSEEEELPEGWLRQTSHI